LQIDVRQILVVRGETGTIASADPRTATIEFRRKTLPL